MAVERRISTTPAEDVSLEEKAALTSGASFWATERYADARVVLSDGPHGVRAQMGAQDHLGIAASEPATCFPPASGLSRSWDPDIVGRVAAALGREAQHYGVGVQLGPGINIKRDPRCGRNFEYFSEDPLLSGVLGSAWVTGIQSEGVGASVKHFAANNAETDRLRSDSRVEPRALREIYLRAFERVVREAKPWTVMSAYNKVNGVYASESRWLLTTVLREEWGYDGLVVSDWGAVRDRATSLAAGLDLTMPGGDSGGDALLADAVRGGDVPHEAVDRAARNVIRLIDRAEAARRGTAADFEAGHEIAREAAARSIVLLKNEDDLLPLAPEGSIAVIGRYAEQPRFQGGGSSHVTPTRVDVALEEIRAVAPGATVTYEPGWAEPGEPGEDLVERAAESARAASVAVVFLGLDESEESEGWDRERIDLPPAQLELLRRVVAAQPRTVVVLSHGGVVLLAEVAELASAILDGALLGQGGGHAIARTLFGLSNPSGRLSETVPERLSDAPSFLDFPGEHSHVTYGEGIFVGYRGYDARDLDVSFPFGHGLSYTTFAYDDLRIEPADDRILVTVRVRNTGRRAGREVVQVYAAKIDSAVRRAPRELGGFGSVELEPGESADVTVVVERRDLAYWDERLSRWSVEDGDYAFWAAASSRDLRLRATVRITGDEPSLPLTLESTLGEVLAHPVAGPLFAEAMSAGGGDGSDHASETLGGDMNRLAASIPLDRLAGFSGGSSDPASLQALLDAANASMAV